MHDSFIHDYDSERVLDEVVIWFDDDDLNTHTLGEMLLINGALYNVEVLS